MEERMIKSVTASMRQQQGSLISCLIIGDRGSGKSRFLLELHKHNVECAYEKLGYGKKTSQEWADIWKKLSDPENTEVSDEEKQLIKKAAKRCLMLVLDYDMEGQEQLLMRLNIMPREIADSWEKWPVTGSPKDVEDDEYEHQFDEGHRALNYYLERMKEHSLKYPEFAGQRVLVLEDCGEMANSALDHYFYVTTRGRTKDFAQHFATTQQKAMDEGKPHSALFPQGQRDTFGMVNLEIKDFIHQCIIHKRDMGYNFYATARLAFAKDEETGKLKSFATGKTYIYEGYLDLIIKLIKRTKERKDGTLREEFIIDTLDGAKNRMCPSFWMFNDGPRAFFERLVREKYKDPVLSEFDKEGKKKKRKKVVKDDNGDGNGEQANSEPEESET